MEKQRPGLGSVTLVRSEAGIGANAPEPAEQDRLGAVLRELFERLCNGQEKALCPGSLAQWKPGLQNRRHPAYGEPLVVVAIIDPPLPDHSFESGSPYFLEPLSVVMGITDAECEFHTMHVDIRRFEPYVPKIDRT